MRQETKIHQIGPVCRFGPGGDFVHAWPSTSKEYLVTTQSPLNALLERISKLIGFEQKQTKADNIPYKGTADVPQMQGTRIPNPKAIGIAKNNNDILGQTLLFSDNNRTIQSAQPKPKYNIRTSRRAAKKGFTCRFPAQGSLFEADKSGIKTA